MVVLDHPGHGGIPHDADAPGVGDKNGSFEQAALVDPVRASHIAIAVSSKVAGEHAMGIRLSTRENRGNSGSHRAFADDEVPFSGDERFESDLNDGGRYRIRILG